MAVNYSNTVKQNRLANVNDAVNGKTYVAGSGAGTQGKLVIGTSALSGATGVLCTITLPNPAFTVGTTTLTLLGVPLSGTASAGGTAALAEVRNSADVVIASGLTVGTSGTDIIINSVTITSGQTVQVTSGVITHG